MRALADLLVRKSVAWVVVLATLVVAVLGTVFALRLENDDNLLAFLPKTNPDVAAFYDVSHRFGSLEVALVGIGSSAIFTPRFLGKLKALTTDLNENTPGVDFVLSLTSVDDFSPDPKGGIDTDYLVRDIPGDAVGMAALREKVMSRDQVVGNLVAADGQATVLYCSIASGTDPRPVAAAIRAKVEAAFPVERKLWGGAPFLQSYIYEATQADLRRLTPWACIAIVLIAVASFRDAVGSILALFSTGIGIVAALGIMAACHVKANLVLGSMPVILFSLGSAYPIHLLTRYYTLADEMGCEGALRHTLGYVGPVVVSTGLVTIAGLLSFLAMDIEPMRTFGLFTAIGVLVTLVLAITFVPAVVRLVELRGRRNIERPTSRWMVAFCTFVAQKRVATGIVLGLIALAGAALMLRLDTRIDAEAFFSADSPPAEASRFLHDHFGGGQFFQVQIAGDMTDPAVLREVRAAADRIALLPHVASVNHVGNVVSKLNEAIDGDERIPDTAPKVKALYGLLAGKKAVRQLVTEDHTFALLHVKVDTERAVELEAVETDVKRVLAESLPATYETADVAGVHGHEATRRLTTEVADRLLALSKQFGVGKGAPGGPLPARADAETAIAHAERSGEADTPEARGRGAAAILAYIRSEEFTGDVPKSPADADARVASTLAGLPPGASREAVSQAVASAIETPSGDPAAADLADSLGRASAQIRSRIATGTKAQAVLAQLGLVVPEGAKGVRFGVAVANALLELQAPTVALPSGATAGSKNLTTLVTGMPVLNHGLSRSVGENQIKSFEVAMGLVLLIALFLYRSVGSALLAVSPMVLTLLVLYGGMGLLGVRLDIGTSMLASLSIGAGVDYAVHFLAAWKAKEDGTLEDAVAYSSTLVGRAIWTNALMVAAGFAILTGGQAKPLRNVGALTAAAMIVAGLATFVVIPTLARKLRYDTRPMIEGIRPASKALRAGFAAGTVIVGLLLGLLLGSREARADEAGDKALASLDEALNRAKSYYFEFDVTNKNATKLALIVRIKGDKRLTEFTAPADMKGTKVLLLSPTQSYVYLPAFGKVRRVASSVSEQGFMGMTFTTDDFTTVFSPQYTATIASDDPAEMKLVAVAKRGETPPYAKIEFTIAKDRFLPTELKYYNAAGTNVKTEVRTGYTCEGNICAASEQTMTDNTKNGAWTKMVRRAFRVNVDLSDDMFSKRALEH